jgi:hypothetical protein
MGFGDKANTQQPGERARIHRAGLYFGVADGFEHLRVGQGQWGPVAGTPVRHPVPITGAFNYRVNRPVKLLEKKTQICRSSRVFSFGQHFSVVINGYKCHISAM